jgi:DNA-binding transcriptional MerR regulator
LSAALRTLTRKLTTGQTADHLGVSRSTVIRWANDGVLEPDEVMASGHRRFALDRIEALAAEIRAAR